MRHSEYKEWYTCDRCGKKIEDKPFSILKFPMFNYKPISFLADANYHLCSDCRKEFDRFMRNE